MKKSRSLVAMLMAIVLLLSVSAVSAFAADETVTSVLDFTTLTPGEDFAAVTAAVKGLGAVDCANLVVGDCYHPTLTGKGYNGEGYFIQKIEAGEGKVFAEAPVVTLNYRITNANPLGYIKVQGSIDGVTYYDFANLNTATGDAWTAEAKATADVVLNGGEGSSTVWVKVSMQHWGGPDAACVDKCTVTGKVKEGTGNVPVIPENQISSEVNFEALSEFGHIDNPSKGDPAATKAKMEELGLILPERIGWFETAEDDVNHDWVLQSCYHVFLTPFNGYQNCAYIQKLEAGEGKVLEADAKLTLKYWLAVVGDPSYIVVEVSTDGQTWNEVWANEEGQGQEYNANACTEQQIALPGTAGAATVYVKIVVNRHSGATSGGVTKSVITGTTKEAEIPACQHTNTKVEGAVEATCTEPGFTGNTVCADCGEQITAGTEIAVVDHTFEAGVCTVCGAEDPNYEAPVVDLVIGDNAINGEDITFAYTATEDGTLALSLKSAFSSIRDYCNIYYGINDAELAAYEQNAEIILVAGDVVTVFVEANCKRTMVATWTPNEVVVPNEDLTIGDNAINGEDITFTYTATEDGTLALSLKSAFSSIRDYCNIYYGINGAELAAYEQNAAIALVKGDVVTIFVEANCKRTMVATWTKIEAPVVEDKTITIGDKTFTTNDGKWAYNMAVTNPGDYQMIILDKAYTGEAPNTSWGVALVLKNGILDRAYDGISPGYWTAAAGGKEGTCHFTTANYASVALSELQDGEVLIIFPNGGDNTHRAWAVSVRPSVGKTAALTGFEFEAPACQHTNTKVEGAVEATCTKPGFTGNTVCADCGEQITAGTEIAVLPHTFAEGKCTVCGAADPNYVPACKHTNTKVEGAVEATCEEKGHTGKTVCADCGETVDEGTEIAALGHNYVDGVCTNCNNPKTFDVFGIMVAVMAASGTALVCLKKKED